MIDQHQMFFKFVSDLTFLAKYLHNARFVFQKDFYIHEKTRIRTDAQLVYDALYTAKYIHKARRLDINFQSILYFYVELNKYLYYLSKIPS